MSLLRGPARPPARLPDQVMRRYLAALGAEIDPDPLFRRRLRGRVVNGYVAAREGTAPGHRSPHRMTRLGRAVLYASFAIGITATGTMAASQQAIPGDGLYPMKREIEALRVRLVPARLRDDLAVDALGERIHELHRLADAGRVNDLAAAAAAVEMAYRQIVARTSDPDALSGHLAVAASLIDHLPAGARAAVERAMALPAIGPSLVPEASGSGGSRVGPSGSTREHGGGGLDPGLDSRPPPSRTRAPSDVRAASPPRSSQRSEPERAQKVRNDPVPRPVPSRDAGGATGGD